ncbi:hypothetical protein FGRMN_8545 [Fusarium graminum]|nr:hypothetical protein FGRMN_8545 [Fusarium graminum]
MSGRKSDKRSRKGQPTPARPGKKQRIEDPDSDSDPDPDPNPVTIAKDILRSRPVLDNGLHYISTSESDIVQGEAELEQLAMSLYNASEEKAEYDQASFGSTAANCQRFRTLWKVCLRVFHCSPMLLISPANGLRYWPSQGQGGRQGSKILYSVDFSLAFTALTVHPCWECDEGRLVAALQYALRCRMNRCEPWPERTAARYLRCPALTIMSNMTRQACDQYESIHAMHLEARRKCGDQQPSVLSDFLKHLGDIVTTGHANHGLYHGLTALCVTTNEMKVLKKAVESFDWPDPAWNCTPDEIYAAYKKEVGAAKNEPPRTDELKDMVELSLKCVFRVIAYHQRSSVLERCHQQVETVANLKGKAKAVAESDAAIDTEAGAEAGAEADAEVIAQHDQALIGSNGDHRDDKDEDDEEMQRIPPSRQGASSRTKLRPFTSDARSIHGGLASGSRMRARPSLISDRLGQRSEDTPLMLGIPRYKMQPNPLASSLPSARGAISRDVPWDEADEPVLERLERDKRSIEEMIQKEVGNGVSDIHQSLIGTGDRLEKAMKDGFKDILQDSRLAIRESMASAAATAVSEGGRLVDPSKEFEASVKATNETTQTLTSELSAARKTIENLTNQIKATPNSLTEKVREVEDLKARLAAEAAASSAQNAEKDKEIETLKAQLNAQVDASSAREAEKDKEIEILQARLTTQADASRVLQARLESCEESRRATRHRSVDNDPQDLIDNKPGLHARLRAEERLLQSSSAETQSEDALPW